MKSGGNKKIPRQPETPSGATPNPLLDQNPRQLRVLLVDDHAIVRDGLRQTLADKFPKAEFGDAANANGALEKLHGNRWDVLILDISMPGRSGLDILREIKGIQPDLKVLILTMHPEDQYAIRALKSGAAGYLTKEKASEEILFAIEKVLAGGKYISPTLAESLATKLNSSPEKLPHETLSNREFEIMLLIAGGKSVKEIGADLALSVKTVSTYRARILQKLKFKSNADIIRYAMRERLVD